MGRYYCYKLPIPYTPDGVNYLVTNTTHQRSYFTTLMGLLFLIPLSWLIGILIKESQLFINFLQHINKEGGDAPEFFKNISIGWG